MTKRGEQIKADLPAWLYRALVLGFCSFIMYSIQQNAIVSQHSQRERASIAQSLAVVATKLESLQDGVTDRFTGTQATRMQANLGSRISNLAQRMRDMEIAVARLN